jgi:hypothetical protein
LGDWAERPRALVICPVRVVTGQFEIQVQASSTTSITAWGAFLGSLKTSFKAAAAAVKVGGKGVGVRATEPAAGVTRGEVYCMHTFGLMYVCNTLSARLVASVSPVEPPEKVKEAER